MSSLSLVPCPGCAHKRHLVAIKPDREGKGEVRVFHCPECEETMTYLFRGRGAPILVESKA